MNPLLVLLLAITISGCSLIRSPEKEIVVQTKLVEKHIPLQVSPKPINLSDAKFFVVTEENFDIFLDRYKKENGETWVFYAMSVQSYETLSLNVAEIKRYIEQQKSIIIYYENAIKDNPQEN